MGDGSNNWFGNDRYRSYVRLAKGTTPEDVRPHISRMIKEKLPEEAVKVFNLDFGLKPISSIYTSQESVRTMIWVLSLLAFIILVSASLNYLLIVIGQLGKRSKEMAVRKCYGTSNSKIFARIMGESLFFLVVSVGLAALLVLRPVRDASGLFRAGIAVVQQCMAGGNLRLPHHSGYHRRDSRMDVLHDARITSFQQKHRQA